MMATALRRTVATAGSAASGRRFISVEAHCVRVHRHGHALTPGVLKLETVKLDSAALAPSQALVKMLAAPISPADLAAVAGYEGKAASSSSPRVAGNEGLGQVLEVGAGVKGLAKGDYVLASRAGMGTWATHAVGEAEGWTRISGGAAVGSAELPLEAAAVAVAAPLAAQLLLGDKGLRAGDAIIQNNALSLTGQALIQYAAAAGLKSVNLLPKHGDWGNIVYHLQGLGAGLVVDDGMARTAGFKKLLADLPAARLGLNSAGGAAGSAVAAALGQGGLLVTYGNASRQPVSYGTALFTQRDLTVKGFSLDRALRAMDKAARDAAVQRALRDVSGGDKAAVRLLVARESFLEGFEVALKRAFQRDQRQQVLVMPK